MLRAVWDGVDTRTVGGSHNVVETYIMSKHLLTARELGDLLGFAPGTIVDWAERGTVPAFKLGGRLRFRLSEVEAWLEGQRLKRPDAVGGKVSAIPPRRPARGRRIGAVSDPQGGPDDAC
jgi:excisionase family DNA binding protein